MFATVLVLACLLPSMAVLGDYASLSATGAGSASANGNYTYGGTANGKPYYTSLSAHVVRWEIGGYWALVAPIDGELYTNALDAPTPPESGWTTAPAGTPPAPVMSGGEELAPDIEVRWSWNGAPILDGDMTPSPDNFTDFGTMGEGAITATYEIHNTGNADLSVAPPVMVTGDDDFSVVAQPAMTVPAGSHTTFQLRFAPVTNGLRQATIAIENSDPNENPYTFAVQGTGSGIGPHVVAIGLVDARENLVATIAHPFVGPATLAVRAAYSKPMDTSHVPSVRFDADLPSDPHLDGLLVQSDDGWDPDSGDTVYYAVYDVLDMAVVVAGVDVAVSGGVDKYGNPQIDEETGDVTIVSNVFDVELEHPSVVGIELFAPGMVPIDHITDWSTGEAVGFFVQFSETMNVADVPLLDFSPSVPSTLTLAAAASEWDTVTFPNDLYIAVYDIFDGGVTVPSVDVSVSAARDLAGNPLDPNPFWTSGGLFAVDTENPTVGSLTPNLTVVADANVGTATLTLTVLYSEMMDTGTAPTLGFPVEDPATTLSLNAGESGWTNGLTYVAKYDVADADVDVANIDVRASGARDASGNLQVTYDRANLVSIDTANPAAPTLTGIATDAGASSVDQITNDPTLVISGTSEPSSLVRVYRDAVLIGPTAAAPSGTWTLDATGTSLADGTYVFTATATDAAGNASSASAGMPVLIDTQAPPAPTGRSPAEATRTNDSTPTFSWTAPTDPGRGGIRDYRIQVSGPVTRDSYPANTTYTPTSLPDGSYTWRLYARDIAGNTGAWSVSLTLDIDTVPPTAIVTANDTAISDDDVGPDRFSVTATFSEALNPAVVPALALTPNPTTTFTNPTGAWSGGNAAYTWTYDVVDAGVTVPDVDIGVSGGQDLAGNLQVASTNADYVDIDTQNPTVTIVANDLAICDGDVGTDRFTVTATFSEAMDPAFAPTLTLAPSASTTFTNLARAWSDGNTVYTWTYDVVDAGVTVPDIDVAVSGGHDVAGNLQVARTNADYVDVDTQNPTAAILANDLAIYDGDVGPDRFTVNATFSEAMNPAFLPTLTLTPDPTTTFTNPTGAWSSGNTVYAWTYDVADSGLTVPDIDVGVSGAQDAAGNIQVPNTLPDYVEIDTQNPTCTISVGTLVLYDGDRVEEVTVGYDEPMSATPAPTIQFQTTTGSWTPGTGQWDGTHRIWTQSFTISDANEETQDVDVVVSGARDVAGNTQVPGTLADGFDVDTRSPLVVSAIPNLTLIADANVGPSRFTVTVVYDEAMRAAPTPTITFQNPAAGATLAALGGSWTDARTYVATYNVTDQGVTIYDVDIRVTNARDVAGNVQVSSTATNAFDIDTQNPVISGLTVTGGAVDANCLRTVTFSATVTDTNGCQNAAAIVLTSVELPTANATLGVPYDVARTQANSTTATISGKVDVQNLTSCPATVRVTLDAQDCAGNAAAQSQASGNVVDAASPAIVGLAVTPQDGLVDGACEEPVTFSAIVTENCCIDPGNVNVTPSVTNATMTSVVIDKVAFGPKEVRITGSLLVSDLTGCPAIVRVHVSATDCCANRSETDATANVYDEIIPVINSLWVTPVVEVNAACCFTTVEFSANVTDNCCIGPGNVVVSVTLPTQNAILENTVVHRVQNGQGRVDVSGSVDVRCLTSCPARVSVRVDAYDCCGNDAVPVSSQSLEGLVIDATPPEVQDDSDRIREDTPTRIYVLANDDDNCTRKWQGEPCRCDGILRIYDIPAPPTYGTAAIEDPLSHIRYAPFQDYRGPDEFTYRVVDACGNVSAEATVRLEVVPKLVMADAAYTTCRDEPVSFTLQATDPLVTEENVGQFLFTILDGPAHGVLTGDLGNLHYEEPETALVTLGYAPAVGFVGRDRIDVKFEDPYGETSTAVVDIDVTDCEGATSSLAVAHGTVLPSLLPASFTAGEPAGWGGITLTAADGAPLAAGTLAQVLSVLWDPSLGRYILLLDTGPLSVASCLLTVPLGNGETVILKLALEEGK